MTALPLHGIDDDPSGTLRRHVPEKGKSLTRTAKGLRGRALGPGDSGLDSQPRDSAGRTDFPRIGVGTRK